MKLSKEEIIWIKKHTSSKDKKSVRDFLKKPSKKKSKPKRIKYTKTKVEENSHTDTWIKKTRSKLLINETQSEKEFYSVLSTLNVPFEKQYPFVINKKIFFADAVFHKTHTVIEIDGGYHNKPDVKKRDAERTKMLNAIGYRVIRITNEEIYDIPLFMNRIHRRIQSKLSAYEYIY